MTQALYAHMNNKRKKKTLDVRKQKPTNNPHLPPSKPISVVQMIFYSIFKKTQCSFINKGITKFPASMQNNFKIKTK
jgi:hypothetical protein